MALPTVLTIAGFDPSSGAGITADLAVFHAHGLFGTSCITALTVQSTLGVGAIYPIAATIMRETLECLDADLPPSAIKIGMLATSECVEAVAGYLEDLHGAGRTPHIVLDPVLRSSSGRALLDDAGVDLLRNRLLPLVGWVTPNHHELAILAGIAEVDSKSSACSAIHDAVSLLQHAAPTLGVFVTGGDHLPPDDLLVLSLEASPAALGRQRHHPLPGEHIATTSTHGTGCALSSALACRLVLGDEPLTAAKAAKRYVAEALRRATPTGHGKGPIHHLWPLHTSPH